MAHLQKITFEKFLHLFAARSSGMWFRSVRSSTRRFLFSPETSAGRTWIALATLGAASAFWSENPFTGARTSLESCANCNNDQGRDAEKDDEESSPASFSDIPFYVNQRFRDELGGALNRNAALAQEARYLLATERLYPVERAAVTLAPQVPPPIRRSHPVRLVVDMVATDKKMNVSGNRKFEFWPFGYVDQEAQEERYGVPGPFIRARVGDVLEINFTNKDRSGMAHSIDFHSVSGPGGGSPTTFAEQGECKVGAYLLQKPGLFVYHCAAAPIPVHIHNGMFGLILVEPAEGLPPVDREIYVMQHEMYLERMEEDPKEYEMDFDAASKEIASHVLFNGREGALVEKPIIVNQDETVRIFFGNAGPNLISSFHVIGGIFDRVYREGDLASPPARDIQTTLVPAGGSVVVELSLKVPGNHALVDHSIFRIDKGAVGLLKVKGRPRPDIYDSRESPVFCPGCKTHQ